KAAADSSPTSLATIHSEGGSRHLREGGVDAQRSHAKKSERLFHYRKVLRPGTHFLLTTLRHNPADLNDMRKIVLGQCCKKLPERYPTQRRMGTHQFQLGWLQIQSSKVHEIVGAPLGKFVQQCRDRFAVTVAELRLPVERFKRPIGTVLQDDHHAR